MKLFHYLESVVFLASIAPLFMTMLSVLWIGLSVEKIKLGYTEKMKICLGNVGTSTEATVCLSIFALSQTYCNKTYNLEIRNIFPAVSLGKIQRLLHNERI